MTLPVIVTTEAAIDLAELAWSYDAKSPGLGDQLYEVFLARLAQGADFPRSGRTYYRATRRFLLRPFHVFLMYRVHEKHIQVVALMDARQRPRTIRRTLRGR
ncbi:MAG: type II toxin-antitoxin system RelE/ParE family toxin [Planctomycetes bacterium]|nr:type II toxin-antitoxin system RelE/ParE family toxin [Planctomycetota bacterium]